MATLRAYTKQGSTFVLHQQLKGVADLFGGSLLGIMASASIKNEADQVVCQLPLQELIAGQQTVTFTCPNTDTILWTPEELLYMDVRVTNGTPLGTFASGTVIIHVERGITQAGDGLPPGETGSAFTQAFTNAFTS